MKLIKKVIVVMLLIVLIVLLGANNVNAALQSSGGTEAKYGVDTWVKGIRQMESVGGGFGLSETINSNLTSSSGANSIDIHMEKNTEYGAMAILSASSYGNPSKVTSGKTTTGNETGIVMKINSEWVAAGTISNSTIYSKCANKYKNVYTSNYVAKRGDAIVETKDWHGSTASIWLRNTSYSGGAESMSGLMRASAGSIFSYNGYSQTENDNGAGFKTAHPTRCVVIVGEGI